MATFLVPSFSKSQKNKVNDIITVPSEHALVQSGENAPVPAIASQGFPAKQNGTYVVATRIEETIGDAIFTVGFTSTATLDSKTTAPHPGSCGLNGVCLFANDGKMYGGNGDGAAYWGKDNLKSDVTKKAKEIISILTISNNGSKRSVQFIADGVEGAVVELAKTDFENKNGSDLIFPVATLYSKTQQLEFIGFDQVKSRSPRINQLLKEFANNNKSRGQIQKTAKKPASPKSKVAAKKTTTKKAATTKKTASKVAKKKAPAKKKTAKKAAKSNKKAGKKTAKK